MGARWPLLCGFVADRVICGSVTQLGLRCIVPLRGVARSIASLSAAVIRIVRYAISQVSLVLLFFVRA